MHRKLFVLLQSSGLCLTDLSPEGSEIDRVLVLPSRRVNKLFDIAKEKASNVSDQ